MIADANPSIERPLIQQPFSQVDKGSFSINEYSLNVPVVERLSPDRKYVARIVSFDAEAANLYIGRAKDCRKKFTHRYLFSVTDLHGCIWLAESGHALAYSTGGADYGRGYLGIWDGKNKLLRRARFEAGYGYEITSYHPADRELNYDYLSSADGDAPPQHRHVLIQTR